MRAPAPVSPGSGFGSGLETTLLCHLSQQEAILEDLRTDVPVHFNFLFSDSHVEVISGKQEGTNALDKPRPFYRPMVAKAY